MGHFLPRAYPARPPVPTLTPMPSRRFASVAAALVTLAVVSPAVGVLNAAPAQASTRSPSTVPVYRSDFPDPFVLNAGGVYFAYATGSAGKNLQVMSSPDLTTWGPVTDPLPALPGWASTGLTWAPSVAVLGGRYVMYYTVHSTALNMQCISMATSATPVGPFADSSTGPLVCQQANHGSIDPNVTVLGGAPYLLWKSDDNAPSTGSYRTHLWGQKLNATGTGFLGSGPTLLLTGSLNTWQYPVIEGPAMVQLPGGGYDLFYGAGWWDNTTGATGYAYCSTPLGPCTNKSVWSPWMATNSAINKNGPAGPSIFTDATGQTRIAYHAWGQQVGYGAGGSRMLWVDRLSFSGSTPSLG
jgi:hypothetical protein